jgi:hypothetical protein
MIKLTALSLLISMLLMLASCNPKGESYNKFTGYVSIMETIIPDSGIVGQTIPVFARASAPNGCWSDLRIYLGKSFTTDTLFAISATGLYESYNGLCTEIIITADTTFEFKPDSAGTYIFVAYSSALIPSYDTIFVRDSINRRSPVLK